MTTTPPPQRWTSAETCPDDECQGRGRWTTRGDDGAEGNLCGVCDGTGVVVRCVICLGKISPVEADANGGSCESCRIDSETADGAAEYARVASRHV